jgi:branched-chain amino acid transport system permease protein
LRCSSCVPKDCSAWARWAAISPESDESADGTGRATGSDPATNAGTTASSEPGTDSGDGSASESGGEARETGRTRTRSETGVGWPLRYLREHLVHIGVLAFFALYPALYAVLVASPLGAELTAVLPRVETMTAVFYFGLFAMAFDFISGYTGYLSFGHAVFYGAGAYLVVLGANGRLPLFGADVPFMFLLVLAGLLGVALAVLVGSVSFRLTGVYFAMITLGFAQVFYVFVRGWDYVSDNPRDGVAVLGRTEGFDVGIPYVDALNLGIGQLAGEDLALLGLELSAVEVSYYMIGLVVAICYLAMQRIIHSPFGRVMIAIRENEQRAEAIGYDTFRYKLGAFAISGFFAAIAGGLFAGYRWSVSPENSLFFLVTGDALLAAIIGGFGTLAGPLFGRLFDETVQEFLSDAGQGGGLLPYLRENLPASVLETDLLGGLTLGEGIETFLNGHESLYIGALFVLFVLFVPGGLLGTIRARLGGPVAKRIPDRASRYVPKRAKHYWNGLKR